MLTIKETIIVEGKYDKIKLSSLVDANIIESDGFAIFSDRDKIKLIKNLAEKNGVIILTDSDKAGFTIRNYIANCVGIDKVKHAYIPDIFGKEKRKDQPSKEGKLGVEGVNAEWIKQALMRAGITLSDEKDRKKIMVADLYEDGLCGKNGSYEKRKKFLSFVHLPQRLSTKAFLSVLNSLYTYEEYKEIIKNKIFYDDE